MAAMAGASFSFHTVTSSLLDRGDVSSCTGEENKNRYVFATQSLDLRQQLRKVPGSPIVYIARSVMLLETPSDQTMAKKRRVSRSEPCPRAPVCDTLRRAVYR